MPGGALVLLEEDYGFNPIVRHYPPWQPSGSKSMSKVGTWFLMVQVTSLDRIWPKVNDPSALLEKSAFLSALEV